MIITHKIKMDLTRREVTPRVDAVQDDKYSRDLEITLLSGGAAWEVPEGCTAAVSYVKPDGTVGKYDTLPDGGTAWSAAGNVLTVALAPQALTVAGAVALHVHVYSGEAVLSTFEILLNVQRNPAINADSEDYINVSGCLPGPEAAVPGQYLAVKTVDENGRVTAVEAVDAPAGDSDSSQNGCGLTSTEKSLILSLFKNAAYTSDMSATIAQLEALWSAEDAPDEPVEPDLPAAAVAERLPTSLSRPKSLKAW